MTSSIVLVVASAQPVDDGGSPVQEAWELMRGLVFSQRHRFMAIAAEFDLHPAQSGALMQMRPGVPLPMSEIAAMLHCDNSNVTGIVDRLAARGLVERRSYEQDRRVKHVVLTPAGVAVRERIRQGMSEVPSGLGALGSADQALLADLLRRASNAMP
jgi:DNA-binding MarR family transcriptional regulator